MGQVLVVLDTNALHDDPLWQRPAAGKLLALARRGLLRVAVPKIVLMELERQRRTTAANKLNQLKAAPKKVEAALTELGLSAEEAGMEIPNVPALTLDDLMFRYAKQVEDLVASAEVEVLPIPAVTHERVLERDLAVRAPFDINGRGYRDALIWESILARVADTGLDADVFFVTNDQNFGPPDALDPDLEGE